MKRKKEECDVGLRYLCMHFRPIFFILLQACLGFLFFFFFFFFFGKKKKKKKKKKKNNNKNTKQINKQKRYSFGCISREESFRVYGTQILKRLAAIDLSRSALPLLET